MKWLFIFYEIELNLFLLFKKKLNGNTKGFKVCKLYIKKKYIKKIAIFFYKARMKIYF